jgi:hypothetical protein
MKKLFIVTTNPTTGEQDKAFQEWFAHRFNWWKWLNQTWLLIDESGTYSASDIRNEAVKCFPNVNLVVFEINPYGNTWAGFGPLSPTDPTKNMFAWVHKNWKL